MTEEQEKFVQMVEAERSARVDQEKRIKETAQELYTVLKSRGLNVFEYEQAIKQLDTLVRFRTSL